MKTFTLTLFTILCTTFVNAQTKYAFAYSTSSSDKTLYISYALNLSNFEDCQETGTYGTNTLTPDKCVKKKFEEGVIIQSGNRSGAGDIKFRGCKSNLSYESLYGCDDYFYNEDDVNKVIRDIIVEYRGLGYALVRISLN